MSEDFYCDEVLSGRTAVRVVAETEEVLAYHHTRPFWPVHIVVIPKRHVPSLIDLGGAGEGILAELEDGADPNWEQALDGFAQASQLAPDLARAWNNQGVALARLGRLDEARGAYARALTIDANLDSPHQNLIVLETRASGNVGIATAPSAP